MNRGRLLLVDDEEEILDLLRLSFREFESVTAINTAAALDALRQSDFDVLITDIRMPGESGLSLIERAKAANPALIVVVITGHHQEMPAEIKDKVHHWILKPFKRQAIRDAVLGELATH
jgi:DNA-binding NtrC family response regulator